MGFYTGNGGLIGPGQLTSARGVFDLNVVHNFSTSPPFSSGVGFNSSVSTLAIRADEKIYVGGFFTAYQGLTTNYIVGLNKDGTRYSNFSTYFDNNIRTIAVLSDNRMYVGGAFTTFDSFTNNRLIRLNSNGLKDTGFNTGSGFNSTILAMAIQSDGKILAGGVFNDYNGTTQSYITRLNTDGTRDTGFSIGTGFNNVVRSMAIQSDGKIIVGGEFGSYNGTTSSCLARLNTNGTIDTSFSTALGTGFFIFASITNIFAIAIQSDGKILVGGQFTSLNGTTQNRITRLNTDGTRDTSFNIGTGFNTGTVSAIRLQPDGKILVGGSFTSYNGTTQNYITRLNTDGTRDTSFDIGTGFNDLVNTLAIQSDGKILVGGAFTTYRGIGQNRITRISTDGSISAQ